MRKFVKMINNNDPRHLLKDEVFDESYEDDSLLDVYENILFEYYDLKNDSSYLKSRDAAVKKKIELIYLDAILLVFAYDKELALSKLKQHGKKYKSATQVEKAIQNRIFDLKIKKQKAEKEAKAHVKVTFEKMCVPLQKYYKMPIDRNITVASFIALESTIKQEVA